MQLEALKLTLPTHHTLWLHVRTHVLTTLTHVLTTRTHVLTTLTHVLVGRTGGVRGDRVRRGAPGVTRVTR